MDGWGVEKRKKDVKGGMSVMRFWVDWLMDGWGSNTEEGMERQLGGGVRMRLGTKKICGDWVANGETWKKWGKG